MTTHQKMFGLNSFYFITFTCYKWLSLIHEVELYDYIPQWSKEMSKKGVKISVYVIMPNHIHLIVHIGENCENPNLIIGEAKRFMAYEIVKRLNKVKNMKLLQILKDGVQENERKKGKKHQVFRLSFDAKEIDSERMMDRIVDYIHRNPCSGKWNLVSDYTEYKHSSAKYYELGETCEFELYDYRE